MGRFWIFFVLFSVSCFSPPNLVQLRHKARNEVTRLTLELQKIQNIQELESARPRIKKRFDRIGQLVESAMELESDDVFSTHTEEGDRLFLEMARLYEMPGGREILEEAQRDAVRNLVCKRGRISQRREAPSNQTQPKFPNPFSPLQESSGGL